MKKPTFFENCLQKLKHYNEFKFILHLPITYTEFTKYINFSKSNTH